MDINECKLVYRRDGIVKIPSHLNEFLPSGAEMQMLAEEVIGTHAPSTVLVTTENIRVLVTGKRSGDTVLPDVVETRKVTSRVENFVSSNRNWTTLCTTGGPLSTIVGEVCTEDGEDSSPWCLYKEKLNIKPVGTSGFAPHLDTPSLRVTGLCDNFITVMIAIDDMTVENGCLQVCRGNWSEENSVECEQVEPTGPAGSSNPDGNGRRGAILPSAASELHWEPVECVSGDVFIFSGWLPHRSASNMSKQPRRAVFLTYNHSEDGELSDTYYRIMRDLRAQYLKHFLATQGITSTPIAE